MANIDFFINDGVEDYAPESYSVTIRQSLDYTECVADFVLEKSLLDKIGLQAKLKVGDYLFFIYDMRYTDDGAVASCFPSRELFKFRKQVRFLRGQSLCNYLKANGLNCISSTVDVARVDYIFEWSSLDYLLRCFCHDNDVFYCWDLDKVSIFKDNPKVTLISEYKDYEMNVILNKDSQQKMLSEKDVLKGKRVVVDFDNYKIKQRVSGKVTGEIIAIESTVSTSGNRSELDVI